MRHPVIERLLAVPPVEIKAVGLLGQLLAGGLPPDAEGVLALGPELEAALAQAERISDSTKRIVEQCQKLRAMPSNRVPPGF